MMLDDILSFLVIHYTAQKVNHIESLVIAVVIHKCTDLYSQ